MNAKLACLFCAASLAALAGASPAVAGEFSFGFSFGYSNHPFYGYVGYPAVPPTYVYRAYPPPVFYGPHVVSTYYYAPYTRRVATVYRPHRMRCGHGRHCGHYAPRRYVRH